MIGDTIKELRIKKDLTIANLAKLAGVDENYLQSIEENHFMYPSFEFLDRVSSVLGVSADTFIYEGSQQTYDSQLDIVISKAFEQSLSSEDFVNLLKFTRKQELNKLQRPVSHKLNKLSRRII